MTLVGLLILVLLFWEEMILELTPVMLFLGMKLVQLLTLKLLIEMLF